MVNELRRYPLPIRLHARQIHREVANVAGQHDLTLAIQNIRDGLPLCDDGLPRLLQFRMFGIDDSVVSWLRTEDLWGALTPHEVAYLEQINPPRKADINFSWQSERLIVLLWALGKIPELPDSATQCDTSFFKSVLPPFADTSTQAFVGQASLIDGDSLRKQAALYLEEHWKARDAEIHERSMPPGIDIDIEIVQERHHAINWITGYEGLPWDEVTTDT